MLRQIAAVELRRYLTILPQRFDFLRRQGAGPKLAIKLRLRRWRRDRRRNRNPVGWAIHGSGFIGGQPDFRPRMGTGKNLVLGDGFAMLSVGPLIRKMLRRAITAGNAQQDRRRGPRMIAWSAWSCGQRWELVVFL
jgi:hypothetical protein